MFRIPFEMIEKGSNIIIYGMGYSGKKCYDQLIEKGYAKLVAIVDNNRASEKYEGHDVILNDDISKYKYEYILISLVDEDEAESIKNKLYLDGCELKKIITLHEKWANQNNFDFEHEKDFVEYINLKYNALHQYSKEPEDIFYELVSYIEGKTDVNIKEKLIKTVYGIRDKKCCFNLLMLMYKVDIFDVQLMRLYMQLLKEIEWTDHSLYNLVIDTTLMVFNHSEYFYASFFDDRIELQKKICRDFNLYDFVKMQKKENEKLRIAMVVERFSPNDITDAPSHIVESYAKELSRQGYEVKIFILFSYADGDYKNREIYSINNAKYSSLCDYDRENFQNTSIDIYDNYIEDIKERLIENIRELCKFSPDFIWDFADEMFVEAYSIYGKIKIVNSTFRGFTFSSIADKYIMLSNVADAHEYERYSSIDKKDVLRSNCGNIIFFKNDGVYTREMYGFVQKDYLITSVGTRLKYEIDEDMIFCMCELMEKYSQIKWIIVGDKLNTSNIIYNKLKDKGRIIEWGIEDNLIAFYRLCNIFLNPIRRGGGMSIRLAMYSGLPIVMSDNVISDSYSAMNKKHIVHGGYDKMMEHIEKLMLDEEFYENTVQEVKKQVCEYSVENDVREQMDLIKKALNIGLMEN